MTYKGSCHCGAVAYEVEGSMEGVIQCNCSICHRKGAPLWFVPRTQFTLQSPETAVAIYTFNKHAIKHQFCTDCGCAPFAFAKDKQGIDTAAINVRCLEGIELTELKRVPLDGRSF